MVDENKRTLGYVVAAALTLVVAWEPWRARQLDISEDVEAGHKLLPDFKDPLAATSLQIIKFDEDTSEIRAFQVNQVNGLWSIPSHQNYPADAREHLAQAATSLLDLEILGVASSNQGDHEMYGVIDPDVKTLKAGTVGVGTRVTMKNAKDDMLADLIIGKEDSKDRPGVRFVRIAGRDRVYKVAIKTDKLSTRFGDWIEKDLLKLNAFDVRSIQLNDYSTEIAQTLDGRAALEQLKRSEMNLSYDDTKSAWKLDRFVEFENGKPQVGELAEDEELNNEKLNGLKTALDDLQIVDVERKPKGIEGLEVPEEFAKNRELVQSLAVRGFYPVPTREGRVELLSSEGEVRCRMKDGLEYVLRFGNIAGADNDKADKEQDPETKKSAEGGSKVNRFLFVMAEFNQSLIPQPELAELPAGDETPQDDKAADPDAKAGDKPAEKNPDKAVEKTADKAAADDDDDDATLAKKKAAAEQRAAIVKENHRKQEEYDEKVKKGEEHVKELNNRFTGWYYVISDDTYRKIHLGRADAIKKKAPAAAGKGDSVEDLNELEKQGLK